MALGGVCESLLWHNKKSKAILGISILQYGEKGTSDCIGEKRVTV